MAKNDSHPATKSDIRRLEKRIAKLDGTGGRIDKLDGRMDKLDGRMDKLDGRMDRMTVELVWMKENMATKSDLQGLRRELKQDIGRLTQIVLDSAEKGRMYFEKALSHGHILQEHEAALRDHGRRLGALETRP